MDAVTGVVRGVRAITSGCPNAACFTPYSFAVRYWLTPKQGLPFHKRPERNLSLDLQSERATVPTKLVQGGGNMRVEWAATRVGASVISVTNVRSSVA